MQVMTATKTGSAAQIAFDRVDREARLAVGPVPDALDNPTIRLPRFEMSENGFLLRVMHGLTFYYERGTGVRYTQPEGVSDLDVSLFYDGSMYGAVALMNGLVPLHASAVCHEGRVHAFTGTSGAGKSTLAAGLSTRGLPLFADDVLLLHLDKPGNPVMCKPGHKRLKLWRDALDITGLDATHPVRDDMEKFYVETGQTWSGGLLPFASLTILASSNDGTFDIEPVKGIARMNLARSALYRPQFAAGVWSNAEQFRILSAISRTARVERFTRPIDHEQFWASIDRAASNLRTADAA